MNWNVLLMKTERAEECLGREYDGQSLKIVERFCYIGDMIKMKVGAVDSVVTRTSPLNQRWQ